MGDRPLHREAESEPLKDEHYFPMFEYRNNSRSLCSRPVQDEADAPLSSPSTPRATNEVSVTTRRCPRSAADRYLPAGGYLRADVLRVLEDPTSSVVAVVFHTAVVSLIVGSTLCAVLVTVRSLEEAHAELFSFLELVFTVLFTLEILVRAWAMGPLGYLSSPSNLVDVLATLPWYIEAGIQRFSPPGRQKRLSSVAGSFRTLRMARLVRMVRLAKVVRHSETVAVCLESVVASQTGLFVLVSFVGMGTVLSATAVYAAESDVPGGSFTSIPASMWWALTTITTVGYGDMVPRTALGKCVGCCTMVGGTLIVSLSVAMISSSFTEQYRKGSEVAKAKKANARRAKRLEEQAASGNSTDAARPNSDMLVQRLADLDEQTQELLAQLEGEIEYRTQARHRENRSHPDVQVDILMECLRGHSASMFKAARALAHQLSDGEDAFATVPSGVEAEV